MNVIFWIAQIIGLFSLVWWLCSYLHRKIDRDRAQQDEPTYFFDRSDLAFSHVEDRWRVFYVNDNGQVQEGERFKLALIVHEKSEDGEIVPTEPKTFMFQYNPELNLHVATKDACKANPKFKQIGIRVLGYDSGVHNH